MEEEEYPIPVHVIKGKQIAPHSPRAVLDREHPMDQLLKVVGRYGSKDVFILSTTPHAKWPKWAIEEMKRMAESMGVRIHWHAPWTAEFDPLRGEEFKKFIQKEIEIAASVKPSHQDKVVMTFHPAADFRILTEYDDRVPVAVFFDEEGKTKIRNVDVIEKKIKIGDKEIKGEDYVKFLFNMRFLNSLRDFITAYDELMRLKEAVEEGGRKKEEYIEKYIIPEVYHRVISRWRVKREEDLKKVELSDQQIALLEYMGRRDEAQRLREEINRIREELRREIYEEAEKEFERRKLALSTQIAALEEMKRNITEMMKSFGYSTIRNTQELDRIDRELGALGGSVKATIHWLLESKLPDDKKPIEILREALGIEGIPVLKAENVAVGRDVLTKLYSRLWGEALAEAYLKNKDAFRKVIVGLENVAIGLGPGQYAGDAEAIAEFVKNVRKHFVNKLVEKGVPKEEAEKVAKENIGMILDIAHYWLAMEGEGRSPKEFYEKLEKFMKENKDLIRGIHVSDVRVGDDHIYPGAGVIDYKKILEIAKKEGIDVPIMLEIGAEETMKKGAMAGDIYSLYAGLGYMEAEYPRGYFAALGETASPLEQGRPTKKATFGSLYFGAAEHPLGTLSSAHLSKTQAGKGPKITFLPDEGM